MIPILTTHDLYYAITQRNQTYYAEKTVQEALHYYFPQEPQKTEREHITFICALQNPLSLGFTMYIINNTRCFLRPMITSLSKQGSDKKAFVIADALQLIEAGQFVSNPFLYVDGPQKYNGHVEYVDKKESDHWLPALLELMNQRFGLKNYPIVAKSPFSLQGDILAQRVNEIEMPKELLYIMYHNNFEVACKQQEKKQKQKEENENKSSN